MRLRGESLASVSFLAICIAVIVALIVPAVAQQRAQARASACGVNLRMIGLAIHNYHSAFRQLPPGSGGTEGGIAPEQSNQGRLGPLVGLLPFVEEQALWEKIVNPYTDEDTKQSFPAMGPVPWFDATIYKPWSQASARFACPDRPQANPEREVRVVYTLAIDSPDHLGVTASYVACYGDGTRNAGQPLDPFDRQSVIHAKATNRGMFQAGLASKFRDVLDGLSFTAMFSETQSSVPGKPGISGIAKDVSGIGKNPALCLVAANNDKTQWWEAGRGSRWCDGALPIMGFQTILPPNAPSCTSDGGFLDAIASASSHHDGGVHLLMADGRVMFVTDTIDTGDLESPGVAVQPGYTKPGSASPYGVWGAMGTRASLERLTFPKEVQSVDVSGNSGSPDKGYIPWKDKMGKSQLMAKFVKIIDEKTIELEDRNGILHRVPLNSLRDQDIFRAVQFDLLRSQQGSD